MTSVYTGLEEELTLKPISPKLPETPYEIAHKGYHNNLIILMSLSAQHIIAQGGRITKSKAAPQGIF